MQQGVDFQFFDTDKCITIKEFSFIDPYGMPNFPPVPKVDEYVFLDDKPYKVTKVIHDWAEPKGELIGIIITISVERT